MSISRAWIVASFKAAWCPSCCVLALLASAAYAQPPAEDPAATAPAAPAGKYETLPSVPWLSEEYFKNDKRDKSKDKGLRDNVGKIRKTYTDMQKDERGDSLNDQEKVSISDKEYTKAQIFDIYYSQYILPQMTQPERVTEYANDRQNFLRLHLVPIKSVEVHDRLVNMTMTFMLDVAKKNFHPAAPYNAMLVIGELNSKEAIRTGAAAPPEPYLPALAAMLKELASPTQSDPVRVACLVGILRHAEMDGQKQDLTQRWQPKVKLAVIDPMLALLNAKDPPAGRSTEGHLWMQRRALDVLGALGDPGTDAAVARKMEELIANDDAPLSLRCSAALALGRVTSLAAAKFDPTDTARNLGELAVAAGRAELDRLNDQKKSRDEYLKAFAPAGGAGPGGFGPGGPGGFNRPGGPGPSAPVPRPSAGGGRAQLSGRQPGTEGRFGGGGAGGFEDNTLEEALAYREKYKLEVSCKRLKYELACVKAGLEGTNTRPNTGIKVQSTNVALKNYIEQELTKKIDELAKVVETTDPHLELLIRNINQKVTDLEDAVGKAPAGAAKPAAEPPVDDPAAAGPGTPPAPKAPAASPTVPPPAVVPPPVVPPPAKP